jgi:2-polyprenyl-6-methoxyphenol hydroxylase-like FAD-dependent oxidoreductase
MASIVVCGGGVVGLCAAMMLARDGHEVTVVEADPDPPPAAPLDAWTSWRRKGVAQFVQPHNLFGRFRRICDQELPGLTDRLLDAGCVWVEPLKTLPPSIEDTAARPNDDRFRYVTGRRPVVEAAIAAAAEDEPGVSVRRGVRLSGFVGGTPAIAGTPHVGGVRTDDGEEIGADFVVDATGRRSQAPKWLGELGALEPYEEAEDCGFVYYTRYFGGPERPERLGPPLTALGSISVLTLDGDNDTWSVTVFAMMGDTPLKRFRFDDCFDRVLRACPLQAHWLDGEPLTDVFAMAGVLDRYRRFVVDGKPVVTGFAAVGDAWACTNPSAGRGLSVGLIQAQLLRRCVRDAIEDPAAFAAVWDERVQEQVAPFYRNQIAFDRVRLGQMRAIRDGVEPPPLDWPLARLAAVAGYDADLFRAALETIQCLALPQEVLLRPGVQEKIDSLTGQVEVQPTPGPDRRQLLELLAA